MTSSPRCGAAAFSQTSCSSGMLSLKIITGSPASSASTASGNAYGPGTETSGRVAPSKAPAGILETGWGSPRGLPGGRRPGGGPGCRRSKPAGPRRCSAGAAGEPAIPAFLLASQGLLEHNPCLRERVVVLSRDGDDHVVWPCLWRAVEPHRGKQVKVELGCHRHQDRRHPVQVGKITADLHQRHRVAVGTRTHLDEADHAGARAVAVRRVAMSGAWVALGEQGPPRSEDAAGHVISRSVADGKKPHERGG